MVNIVLGAVAGLLVGAILGFVIFKVTVNRKVTNAKARADKIIDEAKAKERAVLALRDAFALTTAP